MTEELKSLTPKELKRLKSALSVIQKAYGLTDSEIDSFFALVKHAGEVMKQCDDNREAIGQLRKAVNGEERSRAQESTRKLMDYLSKKPEGLTNV